MSIDEVPISIPAAIHRPPMLLLDAVQEFTDQRIVCSKTFAADEFFVQGHFLAFRWCQE